MTAPQELGVFHKRVLGQLFVKQFVNVELQTVAQLEKHDMIFLLSKEGLWHITHPIPHVVVLTRKRIYRVVDIFYCMNRPIRTFWDGLLLYLSQLTWMSRVEK